MEVSILRSWSSHWKGCSKTAPLRATRPIINSFTESIDAIRQLDPTFRALTPFKVTDSGAVHLFAGVEVFASLIRIADKLDDMAGPNFFESIKRALHDYLQWLQATVVTGRAILPPESKDDFYPADTPLAYLGWQSEYAHTDDLRADVWLTSQVILLLGCYDILLARSIARSALKHVGLVAELGKRSHVTDLAGLLDQASREDPIQLDMNSPYRVVTRLDDPICWPTTGGQSARCGVLVSSVWTSRHRKDDARTSRRARTRLATSHHHY